MAAYDELVLLHRVNMDTYHPERPGQTPTHRPYFEVVCLTYFLGPSRFLRASFNPLCDHLLVLAVSKARSMANPVRPYSVPYLANFTIFQRVICLGGEWWNSYISFF